MGKKIIQAMGLGMLIMGAVHSPGEAAAASAKVQKISLPAIKVYLNNSQITSSVGYPSLVNGTVMVPLDGFYVRGGEVTYDKGRQTITIVNVFTKGSIKVGSKNAVVNGKKVTYAAAPQQINKQLYIPLRFVSDAIGGALKWDAASRQAFISYSEYTGEGRTRKDAYFLNGVTGTLYKRDEAGVVHSLGATTAKLDPYFISGAQVTHVRISDEADLVTIQYSYGEPSINLDIIRLFVNKGVIMRQAKVHYWQYAPLEELKVYEGNAVMNDGQSFRLIAPDGSVKQTWNIAKLAGTPDVSYSIEAIGENYVLARSSDEGMLTLIDTGANRAVLLYKEFGINPLDMAGFKYDGIKLTGTGGDPSELEFEFTSGKKESKTFTYRLGTE
ncbi:copper amine oxidase N-terminal domain-containing protein [Paenibacillus sp. MMS20-IR301]|uniref:copper amine oxidase N-terminal domain-containing protein n=1 Tax=Paenibacillus sp. MMS20-IR301 TaxID=2895946 RepID=UPI0028E889E2|nr:copper amine oxidase N-terminal domain-containing protein [Paenibacillus sp. MMS20-IR301]WNS44715.1 copper amine oxidase N-terminal domain-containing protein [Paenibacillus sp. MMS20-IR301]